MANTAAIFTAERVVSDESFNPAAADLPAESISFQDDGNYLNGLTSLATLGKLAGMGFGIYDLLGSPSTRRNFKKFYGDVVPLSGTWTVSAQGNIVLGSGGNLLSELNNNELILFPGGSVRKVKAIGSVNQLTLTFPSANSYSNVTLYRIPTLSENLNNIVTNLSRLIVPLGGIIEYDFNDFASNFAIANGQSISRSTYAALWSKVSRNVTGSTTGANTIQYSGADPLVNQIVKFSFTGGGITANIPYYVVAVPNSGNIQVSTTKGGPALAITSSQTGSMLVHNGYGFGDGSATFNIPDRRGVFPRGAGQHGSRSKAAGGNYDGGSVGQENQDQFQGHFHAMGNGAGATGGPLTLGVFNGINNYPAPSLSSDNVMAPSNDLSNGTPRTGSETAPASTAVQYLIRIA